MTKLSSINGGEEKKCSGKRSSVDSIEAIKLALKEETSTTHDTSEEMQQNALNQRGNLHRNIIIVCTGALLICLGLIVGVVSTNMTSDNLTTAMVRHNAITEFLKASEKPTPLVLKTTMAPTMPTSTTMNPITTTRTSTTTTTAPTTTTRVTTTTTRTSTTTTTAPTTTTTRAMTITARTPTTTSSVSKTLTRAPVFACEPGWNLFHGTNACYKALPRQYLTFYDAEDDCQKLGAHLASIHSYAENSFVFSLVTTGHTLGYDSHNDMCWIGLRADGNRRWSWTDGTPVDYMQWARGEPNNWLQREDCTMMFVDKLTEVNRYVSLQGNYLHTWNDLPCHSSLKFAVCKKAKDYRL